MNEELYSNLQEVSDLIGAALDNIDTADNLLRDIDLSNVDEKTVAAVREMISIINHLDTFELENIPALIGDLCNDFEPEN